jgi:hypothetical protein
MAPRRGGGIIKEAAARRGEDESGGRESGGRESGGRESGGRECSGRESGGRERTTIQDHQDNSRHPTPNSRHRVDKNTTPRMHMEATWTRSPIEKNVAPSTQVTANQVLDIRAKRAAQDELHRRAVDGGELEGARAGLCKCRVLERQT